MQKTAQAMRWILPKEKLDGVDYLDFCRAKRNETEYDFAGGIAEDDVTELINFVEEFKSYVKNRSDLL